MIKRIAGTAMAAAAGAALTVGTAAGAGAAPAGSGGGGTPVIDCAHQAVTEPADIIMTCGDANSGFTDIDWYAWNGQFAVGTAHKFWNDCDPACYQGTFHQQDVWIALYAPAETADGQTAFSTIGVVDDQGVRSSSLPGFPFEGQQLFP